MYCTITSQFHCQNACISNKEEKLLHSVSPVCHAAVYLVKQVLWSKHRIRLHDYELNNLHKVKLRLAKDWKAITNKAEMDVK